VAKTFVFDGRSRPDVKLFAQAPKVAPIRLDAGPGHASRTLPDERSVEKILAHPGFPAARRGFVVERARILKGRHVSASGEPVSGG
jgi:hypothetical protein